MADTEIGYHEDPNSGHKIVRPGHLKKELKRYSRQIEK
jgi:hypothetical protein